MTSVWRALMTMLVLAAAATAGSATWLFTHGWGVAVIETGSMHPVYPAGSLLLVDRVDPDRVQVGDVVGYEDDFGRLISHRVTAISTALTGERLFTFRGDANPGQDPMPVADRQLRSRIVAGAPHLGWIAKAAVSPLIAGAVVVVGAVLVVADHVGDRHGRRGVSAPDIHRARTT
jgi:signal peptidase